MARGQVFSLDAVIATVVFVVTFIALYGFVTSVLVEPEERTIGRESLQVAAVLATPGKPQIIDAQQLVLEKLLETAEKPEETIKQEFGIKNDFCLYIEDNMGNLMKLPNGKKSIGNSKAQLHLSDGTIAQCGQ